MNTEDKIKIMQQALIDGVVLFRPKEFSNSEYMEESNIEFLNWNWGDEDYKNIDKPEYIPFTMDDADLFIGKPIYNKETPDLVGLITHCSKETIYVGGITMTYKDALKKLSLLKTPFGKLKK